VPKYKAEAIARHEFLLSRFQAFPIPGSERQEIRFVGNLPRAATLRDAINAAMKEEGIPIPEGSVEISLKDTRKIQYLLSLFVKAAPETVPAQDDPRNTEVIHSYGFTRNFRIRPGVTMREVLDVKCYVEEPSPIAGVRAGREDVYANLHTALRKVADSKITSAAWNAMHVIDDDARNWMSNIVVSALTMQEFATAEEVVAAVKEAFAKDNEWRGIPDRALIHCLLELFTDSDWYGFLSFCIIWPYEVKKTDSASAPTAGTQAENPATPPWPTYSQESSTCQ
jgi:hypothetical protein